MLTFKRVISVIAAALTAAMSVTAYATNDAQDIQIRNNEAGEPMYHIEIKWGSLKYDYIDSIWDPETQTYKTEDGYRYGKFVLAEPDTENAGKIIVTNHSNVDVTVKADSTRIGYSAHDTKFSAETTTETIPETLNNISCNLKAAEEGSAFEQADSVTFTVKLYATSTTKKNATPKKGMGGFYYVTWEECDYYKYAGYIDICLEPAGGTEEGA